MPTYEYLREDGTIFEYRQGINDEPLETCPDTGQKVSRMISGGAGVVYKGKGWYVTDYKNDNGRHSSNGSSEKQEAGKESNEKAGKSEPSDSGNE
jgi:putative FmdB family regulatory protein